eukprot:CAMPEP_0180805552 /NCGR_PEP_ID=MMETSP1038_2-20121128/62083_1 /TAXON_ID=632150 /ORGANISM="Azadinium spinosum, Strain 3D9" /LENGTH=58 /DNA_ID=CAMNT_0022846125 /DNA_START=107 /DNA_END=280 /DNA_ORIENTATION=+
MLRRGLVHPEPVRQQNRDLRVGKVAKCAHQRHEGVVVVDYVSGYHDIVALLKKRVFLA